MDGYCRVYTMLHLVERRRMEEERTKKMSVNDIILVSKHNFAAILFSKTHFCPTLPPQNKKNAVLAKRYVQLKHA